MVEKAEINITYALTQLLYTNTGALSIAWMFSMLISKNHKKGKASVSC